MKKILFLFYGVVAYMVFLGTFLYAMGFVTTFFVPKHINSEPVRSLTHALIIDGLLLTLFALQHSIMARPFFKRWWAKFIPAPIERSTYVLLASVCLLVLFRFWEPIGGTIWQVESEGARRILVALGMIGFGIVLISTFLINHFDLFGLRQVWYYAKGESYSALSFRTPFFYKFVRHPLYLGFMIAFWATPVMTAAHLFFAATTTLYMLVAIRFEERDLTAHFGEQYLAYKNSAPMIVPFLKTSRNADTRVSFKQR